MRLLLDMNLSPRLVPILRRDDVDAVHWSEVGTPAATDREVLAFAREHDFVLATHDLDFGAILAASGGSTPSVVLIRADHLPLETLASRLIASMAAFARELQEGALLTIEVERSRVRLLPLT